MNVILSPSKLRAGAALVLGLLAAGIFVPSLIRTSTVAAVLNGREISLRSPVDGRLLGNLGKYIKPGDPIGDGDVIAMVVPAEDVEARRNALARKSDIMALEARQAEVDASLAQLDSLKRSLVSQRDLWNRAVAERAEQRRVAADGAAKAAHLALDIARNEADKLGKMAVAGATDKLEADRAKARLAQATAAASTADADLQRATIEAASAKSGVNVIDGQSDVSYSEQKLHEVELQQVSLTAERQALASRMNEVEQKSDIVGAASGSDADAKAGFALVAPATSVLWRQLVAVGSDVVKGQEIAQLVDCNDLFVNARLDASSGEDLVIGDHVTVEINGRPGLMTGTVRTVRGGADGASVDAAASSISDGDRYVDLEIGIDARELRIGDQSFCHIGTGARVSFEKKFARKWLP